MKKKVLSLALILCMVLTMLATTVVANEAMTLTVETVNVEVGTQSITVNLNIENSVAFQAMGIQLTYDTTALTLTDVAFGESLANTSGAITKNIAGNSWNADWSADVTPADGVAYVLTFTINSEDPGTYPISATISDAGCFDSELNDVTPSFVAGSITVASPSVPEEPEYTDNYYVTVGTQTGTVQNDGVDTVIVTVDVNGLAANYNSATIVLNYDADLLTFVSGVCNKTATVEEGQEDQLPDFSANNGTLTIRDFGGELATGGTLYTLTFNTQKGGNAEIGLESAGFSTLEQAEVGDLAAAACDENSANITIQHKVTVDGTPSYVTPGEDYTYQIQDYDTHDYEYEVTVKKDGVEITAPTIDADGKFTIENVDGALEITVTKTAITYYNVTWTDASTVLADEVKVSEVVAGGSVSFDIPVNGTEVGDFTYTVKVNNGTIIPATNDSENEGYITYTISNVSADLAIEIVKEEITPEKVTVFVEGDGADDLVIKQNGEVLSKPASVNENSQITLELTPEIGYKYTIKIGDAEAKEIDATYGETITTNADTTIIVTKTWVGDFLNVSEYIQLDGAVMWLIKIGDEQIANMTYAYNNNNFFWSSQYSAYCYLIVGNGNTADEVVAALEGKISVVEETASEISYNGNVNLSKDAEGNAIIDVNDAQLVWNMYSAVYSNITDNVSVEKFLEADVSTDGQLNVNDALAVIAKI